MNDSKIVPLHGAAVGNGQPVPRVIAILERVLAEARRGEIDGIAVAVSRPNDEIATDWEFGTATFRLVAAADYLRAQLIEEIRNVAR